MGLGSTHANAIYNYLFRQTNATAPTAIYLSLHTGDPGSNGANECADATYARVNVTSAFGAPTAGAGSNTAQIEFPALTTGGTFTHFGYWTLQSGGVFIKGSDITPDKAVAAGAIPRFAVGAITETAA